MTRTGRFGYACAVACRLKAIAAAHRIARLLVFIDLLPVFACGDDVPACPC
jgi:hypothetical protein